MAQVLILRIYLAKHREKKERLRWELNPRWRICNPQETNENTGNADGVQHLVQQSESTDSKNIGFSDDKTMLLSVAKDSLRNSRQAVEKLLNSIPLDDHYAMGILGPILAELRDAEGNIDSI